jgi:hypothetical protein
MDSLKLLQLLLRRILLVLLVLCSRLGGAFYFLADEEELRVWVVEVLWFYFGPGETAEFLDNSRKCSLVFV